MSREFLRGIKNGVPIALGYLSVSFGVGILAMRSGVPVWAVVLISLTNLTSAGEVAGIGIIAASGSYVEMALTQLLINLRYSLMGITLSQNLSEKFTLPHRMLAAYGITDEIFGVAAVEKKPLQPAYMYGMTVIATLGWVAGTYIGAVAGEVLPEALSKALGIMLYGMFIAIIVPPAKESLSNLVAILIAAAISCILTFFVPAVSSGFAIIISAVVASALMALFTASSGKEVQA